MAEGFVTDRSRYLCICLNKFQDNIELTAAVTQKETVHLIVFGAAIVRVTQKETLLPSSECVFS